MKATTILAVLATALLSNASPVPEENAEHKEQNDQAAKGYPGPAPGGYAQPPPPASYGGGPGFPQGPPPSSPIGGYPPPGGPPPIGGIPAPPPSCGFPGIASAGVGAAGVVGPGCPPPPAPGLPPIGPYPPYGPIAPPLSPYPGPPPPVWPPPPSFFPPASPFAQIPPVQFAASCSNFNTQSAVACCPEGDGGFLNLLGGGCDLDILSNVCSQKANIACCETTQASDGFLPLLNIALPCQLINF